MNMTRFLLVFSFGVVAAFSFSLERANTIHTDKSWDILIFTQSWPKGACLQWEGSSTKHTCDLPSDATEWTIHGIWPTLSGTTGPNTCDSSWPFDESQVSSILGELQDKWMSVQNVSNEDVEFWSHEWVKHGTCAAQLTQLSSEFKFFSQALDWAAKFNMKTILDTADIKPKASVYDAHTIWSGVQSVIGRKPILNCYNHNKKSYLTEIRICFDKSLSMVDCVGSNGSTEDDLILCSYKNLTMYN